MLDKKKRQALIDALLEKRKRKIIELLTPNTDFVEAYAIDEVSFPDHIIVAQYDGHELSMDVHKWSGLLNKYDEAIELVASQDRGSGFDDQESEDLLRDAWLEVAG